MVLYVVSDAMSLIYQNAANEDNFAINWVEYQVKVHTYNVGAFFENLASIALLIYLVELGISFLSARGAHPSHSISAGL